MFSKEDLRNNIDNVSKSFNYQEAEAIYSNGYGEHPDQLLGQWIKSVNECYGWRDEAEWCWRSANESEKDLMHSVLALQAVDELDGKLLIHGCTAETFRLLREFLDNESETRHLWINISDLETLRVYIEDRVVAHRQIVDEYYLEMEDRIWQALPTEAVEQMRAGAERIRQQQANS